MITEKVRLSISCRKNGGECGARTFAPASCIRRVRALPVRAFYGLPNTIPPAERVISEGRGPVKSSPV